MSSYDTIVIGIGGIGSATAYQLAKREESVLGLEQYNIPHNHGSSHGKSRLIRLSYFNSPYYVPLLNRAYELWTDLDDDYPQPLINITGSLDIGPENSDIVEGAKKSCEIHDVEHEILSGTELNDRFDGFDVPSTHQAVYQPDGGFLYPEQCIVAHVENAHEEGAEIHAQEKVKNWETEGEEVLVETDWGQYTAKKLVITSGAWASKQLDVVNSLTPEERTLAWFQPKVRENFLPDNFPVFHLDVDEGLYYGAPIFNVPGMKIGMYDHPSIPIDPDELSELPRREDEQIMREAVSKHLPDAAGPTVGLQNCIITNTPDEDFILDIHPDEPSVIIGAGFSGHGFKFAPVIGEILADLVIDGETEHDISKFELGRFDTE